MGTRVLDHGLIYNATSKPKAEQVAFFTSLLCAADGALFCGFQVGPTKNAATSTIRLCRSRDDGKTWRELSCRFETRLEGVPGSLSCAELVESAPGRLLLIATWFNRLDSSRPLFDPESEGILPSKQLSCVSTDQGETWTPWKTIPIPDLRGCSATGPILKWNDGRIAFPFESYREYNDSQPRPHSAWVLISEDGGQTWPRLHRIAEDPQHQVYYWDQRLCAGEKDGEYIGFFWSHDLKQKRDLTVHFKRSSVDASADADPPPAPTSIRGQIAAPLRLADGRLLAFVVDRNRPATMKLWISDDGGRTWPEDQSAVIHAHEEKAAITQGAENIDFKQYWEDMGKWSFGHPAIKALADGTILLAYYAGTPGCMSIHWAKVKVQSP